MNVNRQKEVSENSDELGNILFLNFYRENHSIKTFAYMFWFNLINFRNFFRSILYWIDVNNHNKHEDILCAKINEKCRIKFFRLRCHFQENGLWICFVENNLLVLNKFSNSIFFKTKALMNKFYSFFSFSFFHVELSSTP